MNRTARRVGTVLILGCTAGALAVPALGASPQRAPSAIDWTLAKKDMVSSDYRQRSGSRGPSLNSVSKVKLPVLLIDDGDVRSAPEFRHQVDSYTAHYALAKANVSITGLAKPIAMKNAGFASGKAVAVPVTPYKFELDEDSSDLSFERYGAFYNMRISCEEGGDQRCSGPEFLRKLADKLPVVGGKKL
ncbi:MAG: hypothetical protein WKG03_18100 [Telluria sp.]